MPSQSKLAAIIQQGLQDPDLAPKLLLQVMRIGALSATIESKQRELAGKLLERTEQFNGAAAQVAAYLDEVLQPGRDTPPEIIEVIERLWGSRLKARRNRSAIHWWNWLGYRSRSRAMAHGFDRDEVRVHASRHGLTDHRHHPTPKGKWYLAAGLSQLFWKPRLHSRLLFGAVSRIGPTSVAALSRELSRSERAVKSCVTHLLSSGKIMRNDRGRYYIDRQAK